MKGGNLLENHGRGIDRSGDMPMVRCLFAERSHQRTYVSPLPRNSRKFLGFAPVGPSLEPFQELSGTGFGYIRVQMGSTEKTNSR